jgi:hypothetical protein
MTIEIHTPEGAIVEFPDDMSPDAVKAALQRISPGVSPSTPKSASGNLREQYKEAIRKGGDENGNYPGTNIPVPGTLGLLQRRMSDPFGVQDELVGGGAYLGKLVGSGGDTAAASKAYNEAAERIRAEKEMSRERLGAVPTFATDVLGGFGTTGVGGVVGPLINKAVPFAQRFWNAAIPGAEFGAAAGAGNSEGGLPERAAGALEGAGLGFVAGPLASEVAIPAGSALVRSGYNALANPAAIPANAGNALSGAWQSSSNALRRVLPSDFGVPANIDDTLLRALQRQGMTPAEVAAQMAQDQAATTINGANLNVPVALADSGPAMRELAYTVKAQPGAAKTEAERVLEGRQRGQNGFTSQYDRMKEGLERSLDVHDMNAAELEDFLNATRDANSNAAYGAFRRNSEDIPVGDVLQQHASEMAEDLTSNSKLAKKIDEAYAPFIDEKYKATGLKGPSLVEDARHNLQIMDLDKKIAEAEGKGAEAGLGATEGAQTSSSPASAPDRAQSIIGFLRSRGGIKPSGETKAADAQRIPGLINSKGMDHDKAREALVEAGFMREDPNAKANTSVADFHDLLSDVVKGKKVFKESEEGLAQSGREYSALRDQEDLAMGEARQHLSELGIDPKIYDKMSRTERLEVARRVAQNPEQRQLEENARKQFENGEFDKLNPDEKLELSKRVGEGEDPHNVFEELAIRGENNKSAADALQQAQDKFPGDAAAADSEYLRNLRNLREGLITEHQARSRNTEPLSPAKFQNAYHQLGEKINELVAKPEGKKYEIGILTDLKKRLAQRGDEVSTVRDPFGAPVLDANGQPVSLFAKAREEFEGPSNSLSALKAGRNSLNDDLDRVGWDFNKLSPSDQALYRKGQANAIINQKFGEKNTGGNIPVALDTPNIQARLAATAPAGGLDQLNALRGVETRMFQTRNRVMGGSKTAENQQNLGEATFDAATSALQKLTQGKPIAAAAQAITKTFQYVYRFREEDAAQLARVLFETNPAQRRADIARLEQVYGAPRVQQAVSGITQQLSSRQAPGAMVAPSVGNYLAPYSEPRRRNALSYSGSY